MFFHNSSKIIAMFTLYIGNKGEKSMNWKEHLKKSKPRRKHAHAAVDAKPVRALSEISPHATPDELFRIEVEVLRIVERETQTAQPCYFLTVKDEEEAKFSIVVWESQMDQGVVAEGKIVTLDVRVPKQPYTSFTLA
jgi:hypothetical protein